MVGCDDHTIHTAPGEAGRHVRQQFDDRLEVAPGDRQEPGLPGGVDLLGPDQHQVCVADRLGQFLLALLRRPVQIQVGHPAVPGAEQVAPVADGADSLAADAYSEVIAFESEPQPRRGARQQVRHPHFGDRRRRSDRGLESHRRRGLP